MKPKICKICRKEFVPDKPLAQVCGYKCAYKYAENQRQKNLKKQKTEANKELAKLREAIMTRSEWMALLQKVINTLIRTIDKGQPCICTGSYNGKMNCGHFYSVGSNPQIRFHLDNMHLQSEYSNTYKSGDIINYREGLINTYGKEYYEYVLSLKSMLPTKLTIDEIKEAIKTAKEILKELRKEDKVYSAKERLELRKKFNKRIGIYK